MFTRLLVLVAFVAIGPHWVKDKDSYHVHNVYVATYGSVIGDYYEVRNNGRFTAECLEGSPAEFSNEGSARNYVEHCPQ